MLVVLAWVVVAIGCWIGYQLVQQNGRILLRLESLDRQLAGLKDGSAQTLPALPPTPAGLHVGSPAPDFELRNLTNQHKKLSNWRGWRLLLIFFNPSCGFCRQMASDIAALPLEGKDKPMPLLVSTGSLDDNQKLVEEYSIRCPVLLQKQMEIAAKYLVAGTPIGYLIDEHGSIASEMAIGAPALLELASQTKEEAAAGNSGAKVKVGHDLVNSRIKRDGLSVGTSAPAFRLPRLDGGELALEELRGRKVLLVFSDPGCGPCRQLLAKLSEVWSPDSDMQILMVSRGSKEANQAKADEHGLKFPIVLQKQWEISRLYAMFATPIAYLIDEQGVIASNVVTGTDAILALLVGARAAEFREMAHTA